MSLARTRQAFLAESVPRFHGSWFFLADSGTTTALESFVPRAANEKKSLPTPPLSRIRSAALSPFVTDAGRRRYAGGRQQKAMHCAGDATARLEPTIRRRPMNP